MDKQEIVNNNLDNSDFEKFLKDYIKKLDEIIDKFKEFRTTVDSHHHSSNLAKTAGTALSGTGVAMIVGSVFLAPVTSGSSLAIGAGGAVMSVTGGISNVITDYVDYKTSSMIMAEIQSIVKSKEEFDESLRKQLENFAKVIEKLIESGMDKESAIVTAIKGVATGCIDLTEEPNMKLMNTLSTIIKLHHVESAALETLPIIGKTMHISEKTYQFIYNFFGLTGQTGAHIFKTIGRISSVVSIAFTVVDITLLIRDWNTEHPSVEVIEEVRKKLEEEKRILAEFLEVIDATRDRETVLNKVLRDIKIIEDEDDEELIRDYVVIGDYMLVDSHRVDEEDRENSKTEVTNV